MSACLFNKRHLICTIDDCIIPSTINCLRKDNKPSLRGPRCSMRLVLVLVAACLLLVLVHVATPECTRVLIDGQQYDVDNTP